MDNTFIQQKLIPRLTFNPGLALTGFRTTRPSCISVFKRHDKKNSRINFDIYERYFVVKL